MRRPGDPVENQFPTVQPPGTARIALVGQSPGREEDYYGVPFCGSAGALLDASLERCGLTRSQCFVGNVCQHRPNEQNDFNRLDWDGEWVQQGIAQLRADLERFQPSIVLCLGNEALHLFKHGNVAPARAKGAFDWPSRIGDWRGSLFHAAPGVYDFQGYRLKCLAAFHPAAVSRDYSLQAYYRCAPGIGDLERLRVEAGSRELMLPNRDIEVHLSLKPAISVLAEYRELQPVAIDIEGRPGDITSIAFSSHKDVADVIPFSHVNHSRVWSAEDEAVIWTAIKALLEDPAVLKIGQWFTYDTFALAWQPYGIRVQGEVHDTAELFWELFCELDKGLDVQASLLTKEPFYKPDKEKGEMKFDSDEQFWRYNGTDAAVTFECWERMRGLLGARAIPGSNAAQVDLGQGNTGNRPAPSQHSHFAFNCSLFQPKLQAMLRGIRVDRERMDKAQEKAAQGVWELQAQIDGVAGANSCLERTVQKLDEQDFAVICLACLGGSNPRVRRDVVVERWQPMRWRSKGNPWVKAGKLVTALPNNGDYANVTADIKWPIIAGVAYCPKPKTVSRLQAFTPTTLADCEDHVLESKRGEWRRVKQIWKELKHDQRIPDDNRGKTVENGPQTGSTALLGELSVLLGLGINVGSTNEGGDSQRFLYEVCGLRRVYCDSKTGRYSRESEAEWRKRTKAGVRHARSQTETTVDQSAQTASPGRIDGVDMAGEDGETAGVITLAASKRPSTDQTALDKLYADTQDVRVLWVLQQRRLRKVVTDLNVKLDNDGRLRASISLVKETGRMSESAAPTGCGLNRQALNKDLLSICVADEGCELCKLDLEGADSWTVACECAALGDSTMLDDLRAGIKPAQVGALLYAGLINNHSTREQIRAAWKVAQLPEWLYPGAKACAHGVPYGMGWETQQMTLLKNSMSDLPLRLADAKPIVLSKAQIEGLRSAFLSRYVGIPKWQEKEAENLMTKGWIETSTGHIRRFYGRKSEIAKGRKVVNHETWKEALASKPQYYTTYAIKQAWAKMWWDRENWRGGGVGEGRQIVEALALKHDEILTQWRVEDREFARRKLREWFQTPVVIAGIEVVIPAAGKIGKDWSMKDGEKF